MHFNFFQKVLKIKVLTTRFDNVKKVIFQTKITLEQLNFDGWKLRELKK